jgi:hypothetical protein
MSHRGRESVGLVALWFAQPEWRMEGSCFEIESCCVVRKVMKRKMAVYKMTRVKFVLISLGTAVRVSGGKSSKLVAELDTAAFRKGASDPHRT